MVAAKHTFTGIGRRSYPITIQPLVIGFALEAWDIDFEMG